MDTWEVAERVLVQRLVQRSQESISLHLPLNVADLLQLIQSVVNLHSHLIRRRTLHLSRAAGGGRPLQSLWHKKHGPL
jgi:hypothetical protein